MLLLVLLLPLPLLLPPPPPPPPPAALPPALPPAGRPFREDIASLSAHSASSLNLSCLAFFSAIMLSSRCGTSELEINFGGGKPIVRRGHSMCFGGSTPQVAAIPAIHM